jgi:hypothetical protein
MRLMFKGVTLPIACAIALEKTGKTVTAFYSFRSIVVSVEESKM